MPMDPITKATLQHALGGALGWGAAGAGFGALTADKGHRSERALYGGLGGALAGGVGYGLIGRRIELENAGVMAAHAPWMSGVKTKADAKAVFRAQARAAHPDVGGSHAAMQDLNRQWDTVQNHPDYEKLAFYYTSGQRAALTRFGR